MENVITRLVLKPGKRGTKRLHKIYGDQLVCVRYKYDFDRKKRFKTVELIIDEKDWEPGDELYLKNPVVCIQIKGFEQDLRRRIKASGGVWLPERQLWRVRFKDVLRMGLKKRIVWD